MNYDGSEQKKLARFLQEVRSQWDALLGRPQVHDFGEVNRTYQNGKRHGEGRFHLAELDYRRWPPFEHPNYWLDTAVNAVGSPVRLFKPVYEAITVRQLETTGVNQISGADATHADLTYLEAVARERADAFTLSKGRNTIWLANSPLINGQRLGRGVVGALSSDPMLGVDLLKNNPLIRKDLKRFANKIVGIHHSHGQVGVKNLWLGAFGGHSAWERYAQKLVASQLRENFHIEVKLLPSADDEPLPMANCIGEVYRKVGDGIPENHLVILSQNHGKGEQEFDDAFVQGLLTITGVPRQSHESDGASLLATLRRHGCGWVEAHSTAVEASLFQIREKRAYGLLQVGPDRGGRTVEVLNDKAKELIEPAKDAYHLLAACGVLPPEDVADFKESVHSMFPGHVTVVWNQMWNPKITPSRVGALGRFTMTDFVTAAQLPPMIPNLYLNGHHHFIHPGGMTPHEFLARTQPPQELAKAQQVEDALNGLRN